GSVSDAVHTARAVAAAACGSRVSRYDGHAAADVPAAQSSVAPPTLLPGAHPVAGRRATAPLGSRRSSMAEAVAHDASEPPSSATVADRLRGARRRRFVGRAAELELFSAAVAAPVPS